MGDRRRAAPRRPGTGRCVAASACACGAGTPLGDQRGGDPGAQLRDEDRAEDRQAQAGGVVADRLGDAGRLAVGEPRGPVDGVGAGRAEHEPHARAGEDDVPDCWEPKLSSVTLPAHRQKPDGRRARSRAPPAAWRRRGRACARRSGPRSTKPMKKYRRIEAGLLRPTSRARSGRTRWRRRTPG